jgi:predicted NUDIX family phosphoesterase
MKNENVLCIPTHVLRTGFELDKEFWLCSIGELNSLSYTYLPRSQAEKDNSYKQVIPYVLVFDGEGKVLHYQRCGSEKRLSGLYSAGIGGHLNDEDAGTSVYDIIVSGLKREMREELGIEITDTQLQFLGMINEEHTDVGHCHIGVVFKVMLGNKQLCFESEIGNPEWQYPHMLDLSCFELWSALAIKLEQLYGGL